MDVSPANTLAAGNEIHTLCGCDTTSRIQSIGPQSILNKFLKNKELRSLLETFSSGSISKDRVLQVGESILLILLGAKKEKILDELRSRKYFDKLVGASRRAVTPQALGPTTTTTTTTTTNAAQQHILRVYFQVEVWKGESDLNALDWGWKMTHRGVMPIEMTKKIAPDELLKIIKCGCKTDCSHTNCTCKEFRVPCTNLCTSCRGVSCLNCGQISITDT